MTEAYPVEFTASPARDLEGIGEAHHMTSVPLSLSKGERFAALWPAELCIDMVASWQV
jgi:hypothetical protein